MGAMSLDLSVHLAEVIFVGVGVVKLIRVLSRMEEIFKEFPPHRHINGSVLYPKGFEPGSREYLRANGAAAGD